jgi:hypothetical protein
MKIQTIAVSLLTLALNLQPQDMAAQNGVINPSSTHGFAFSLRLGNQHYNTTNVTGAIAVFNGTPAQKAVLVNDKDFQHAVWTGYDSNISFALGPTDGVYNVWVGLKGFAPNDDPNWAGTSVYLDREAPIVTLTAPTNNSTVTTPWLQLKGYSPEQLQSISYDLSNALAVITNQPGYSTTTEMDTNTWEYTKNWFQCIDILLTNGLNVISVHCADNSGNVATTNINIILDHAFAMPPSARVTWPQDGMQLAQSSFTLRGWTEDAASVVSATITDSAGNTNRIQGMVERTGVLWVDNLPLGEGTNQVILSVTNSAGLGTTTNFCLFKSDMILTVTSIEGSLWNPTVNVSGKISDGNAQVWVNGVQGTNYRNGTWHAVEVPVTKGGVASFDLSTSPPK